jgi:hypothetical protein
MYLRMLHINRSPRKLATQAATMMLLGALWLLVRRPVEDACGALAAEELLRP